MNTYQIDTLIELTTRFLGADGVTLTDPTTVLLMVRAPNNSVATYSAGDLTHVSTGIYSYQFTPSQSGLWLYKWQGEGAVIVTSPDTSFYVARSALIAG